MTSLPLRLPELFDLALLLPGLKLLLLVEFLLQHFLQLFVIFGLAEHSSPLLRADISLELMFFLVPPEFDAVGYQPELLFEVPPLLSQLAQFDAFEFLGEKELPVDG